MQRFGHSGSIVCIATYLGTNGFSSHSAASNYDKQVPIRYTRKNSLATASKQNGPLKKFSYVIIGCGVSGSAALGEILSNTKQKDGIRDVLIIDSQRNAFKTLEKSNILTSSCLNRVQCMEGSVVDMNLPSRELLLSDGTTVGYDSCLISVGTKMSNLELGEKMLADDSLGDLVDMSVGSGVETLMDAVKNGQHVSLVGADTWGVIAVASQLADFSKLSGFKGTVSIITPSQGVMASSLPRYLSVALGKRLNIKGVELVPYSQVRYIGGPNTFAFVSTVNDPNDPIHRNNKDYDYSSPQNAKVGIYLSRVYDSLNTSMLYTDIVALFPSSAPIANQGPPMNCSTHFAAKAGLEIGINGGFLVNRCMLASDGVYLSGEVANVRMSLGRGVYTGVDHAYHTGIVAGRNMSGVFDVYDHIPIYEATAAESDIHLTFVGHCSAAFETHGFWWRLGSPDKSPAAIAATAAAATPTTTSPSPSSSSTSGKSNSNSSNSANNSNSSNGAKNANGNISISTSKNDKNGNQGLYTPIDTSPKQQTFTERLSSDFFGFFGIRSTGKKIEQKIISIAPKGKLNVRRYMDDSGGRKLQPPLGLGVMFYVDNDIVVGVLISGAPLSKQRINSLSGIDKNGKNKGSIGGTEGAGGGGKAGCGSPDCGCKTPAAEEKCQADNKPNQPVKGLKESNKEKEEREERELEERENAEREEREEREYLSYSEMIHERARSFIGKPMTLVAATIVETESTVDSDGNEVTNSTGVTDFRSGRLIRLQNLSEVAGYIIAPIIIADDNESFNNSNKKDMRIEVMKQEYKRVSSQLPRPNYRYAASSRTIVNNYLTNVQTEVTTFAPTIMQENVFSVGGDLTGTRAEKLAAAYASGLRYGIEGPGKG